MADELMEYDEIIELGTKVSETSPETGKAILALTQHIAAADTWVEGIEITQMALVVALALWVLRLAFKVARLEGRRK